MSVELYERGGLKVIHAGCPIEWEMVRWCEIVSRKPIDLKFVLVPVVPERIENWRSSAKCV